MSLLADDLKNLGVKNGDILLVHTSIKGLGVSISPKDIFDALKEAVGSEGTILVPSLSYLFVTSENPHFDIKNTPTCIGTFPEFFRTHYAQVRSMHPTHSVCGYGRRADELTQKHINDNTPVGENSPFMLAARAGGKILMLGCSLKPNTFMHGVEEYAKSSYPLAKQEIEYTMTSLDGKITVKKYYPHSFGSLVQRYDRVADILDKNELKSGKLLNGIGYLIDAEALLQKAAAKIRETDKFFVD